MLKRFLVFKGDDYYPSGGMRDFYTDYDTQEEALAELMTLPVDHCGSWAHVYDQVIGEQVKRFKSYHKEPWTEDTTPDWRDTEDGHS